MRDLIALNILSNEEFERVKSVMAVKTAEQCVEEEEKIKEYQNIIDDLKKNRLEYKNDRLVDRIMNRLECSINFLRKACGDFTSITNEVNARRNELEQKRIESQKVLEESKVTRGKAITESKNQAAAGVVSVEAESPKLKIEPKKRGRPKKK